MKLSIAVILYGLSFLLFCNCSKFVQAGDPTSLIVANDVFSNDASANAGMAGLYSDLLGSNGFASGSGGSVTVLSGLSADELVNYSTNTDMIQFYQNGLQPSNQIMTRLWGSGFKTIYEANAIIEGIRANLKITPATRQQLDGEARFVRAFTNYYLLNLFGHIPLIESTEYVNNSLASQSDRQTVLQSILQDAQTAQSELPLDYNPFGGERSRPTSWSAAALLARIYLATGDFGNASTTATSIINRNDLFQLTGDLNGVFLANSMEAIWQLQPVQPQINTNEGSYFILDGAPTTATLTTALLQAFEPGDLRYVDWVDSVSFGGTWYYFPYKYKIKSATDITEYSMVMRLAEQYLIRAEANLGLNDVTAALGDLNVIRSRAGLSNVTINDPAQLRAAIAHERQVELFTEWGCRWLDLKRTLTANTVLSMVKPAWKSSDTLYPIPSSELQNDPHFVQNPGY